MLQSFSKSKINRLHEKCFRIIYSDKQSSFDEFFEKDEFVSIHHQNTQTLGIKMLKDLNGENAQIVNEIRNVTYGSCDFTGEKYNPFSTNHLYMKTFKGLKTFHLLFFPDFELFSVFFYT